jgi:NADH-quinone oxidoreductase subunit L
MTHAFFKALLFLGAGSVIHGMSGEQEMTKMGGLKKYMPITHATMLIACVAIAGIPPFAGFFSKDEILFETFESGHVVLWIVGTLTALMTAFYMFRLLFMTFYGKERMSHEVAHHVHESPPSMTVPLTILATLSIVGGWVGLPLIAGGHRLKDWLAPSLAPVHGLANAEGLHAARAAAAAHEAAPGTELTFMAISVGVALIGILVAWLFYVKNPALPQKIAASFKGLYQTLYHKWYVDEAYDYAIVEPLMGASRFLWRIWDTWIIDGAVNLVGHVVAGTGALLRLTQTGYVGTYAFFLVLGILALLSGFVLR